MPRTRVPERRVRTRYIRSFPCRPLRAFTRGPSSGGIRHQSNDESSRWAVEPEGFGSCTCIAVAIDDQRSNPGLKAITLDRPAEDEVRFADAYRCVEVRCEVRGDSGLGTSQKMSARPASRAVQGRPNELGPYRPAGRERGRWHPNPRHHGATSYGPNENP